METNELILLGLCLWACVATGLAFYYWKHFVFCRVVILSLGSELAQIARGDLEIKIVGNEIIRTYKEKPNGI